MLINPINFCQTRLSCSELSRWNSCTVHFSTRPSATVQLQTAMSLNASSGAAPTLREHTSEAHMVWCRFYTIKISTREAIKKTTKLRTCGKVPCPPPTSWNIRGFFFIRSNIFQPSLKVILDLSKNHIEAEIMPY